MTDRYSIEQIKVAGEDLLGQVERIIHEGNVRRIVIKKEARTIAEFPLTAGVIGAALAPMFAAIGALAAALTHCTLEVERIDVPEDLLTSSDHANLAGVRKELEEARRGEPVSRR